MVVSVEEKTKMGGYSQQCPFCQKWFTSFMTLKQHCKDAHKVAKNDVQYKPGPNANNNPK